MIVADGDGVVVVPLSVAKGVAEIARAEMDSDKQGRRQLYEDVGLPMDETVE